MHTKNIIFIKAPLETVFSLASKIENWPVVLPHYSRVRIIKDSKNGQSRVVEMRASRTDFPVKGMSFPVTWRSVQVIDSISRRIYFKHLAGIAQGMWVVWTFSQDPWGRGLRVSIGHDLRYPLRSLNGWFARDLVGQGFVHSIAGRTLATIKALSESGSDGKAGEQ